MYNRSVPLANKENGLIMFRRATRRACRLFGSLVRSTSPIIPKMQAHQVRQQQQQPQERKRPPHLEVSVFVTTYVTDEPRVMSIRVSGDTEKCTSDTCDQDHTTWSSLDRIRQLSCKDYVATLEIDLPPAAPATLLARLSECIMSTRAPIFYIHVTAPSIEVNHMQSFIDACDEKFWFHVLPSDSMRTLKGCLMSLSLRNVVTCFVMRPRVIEKSIAPGGIPVPAEKL